LRRAFSIVELIFAIILIALVVSILPKLVYQSYKSLDFSINQEAILMAITKNYNILSYRWDENSTDELNYISINRVLDVKNGDPELERVGSSRYRVGHIQSSDRRQFFQYDNNFSHQTMGLDSSDGSVADDIDDFHLTQVTVSAEGKDGYKNQYFISNRVFYISDSADYSQKHLYVTMDFSPISGTSNIKVIETNVSCNCKDTILIKSFVSNVGEIE
jgi:type II secretory pathway pseudopilin PulG